MTELQNGQPARPIVHGPSMEEQLRKAVDDRAQRRTTILDGVRGAGQAGGPYDAKALEPRAMPSGSYIASRLGRSLDRLRMVDSFAESIANTLAGPNAASRTSNGPAEQPPATSLFVIYERTLDEIDRIIDNIESEQARTRNILGD